MALPPICHWERRSKISALGHIAIGTWTMIGCNGCFSHFPFNKSSDHFMGRNCASHPNRDRSSRAGTKASPTKCSQRDRSARVNFNPRKTKSGLTRKNPPTHHFENYGTHIFSRSDKVLGWLHRLVRWSLEANMETHQAETL